MKPFLEKIETDYKNISLAGGKFNGEGIQLVQIFGVLEEAADNYAQIS